MILTCCKHTCRARHRQQKGEEWAGSTWLIDRPSRSVLPIDSALDMACAKPVESALMKEAAKDPPNPRIADLLGTSLQLEHLTKPLGVALHVPWRCDAHVQADVRLFEMCALPYQPVILIIRYLFQLDKKPAHVHSSNSLQFRSSATSAPHPNPGLIAGNERARLKGPLSFPQESQ